MSSSLYWNTGFVNSVSKLVSSVQIYLNLPHNHYCLTLPAAVASWKQNKISSLNFWPYCLLITVISMKKNHHSDNSKHFFHFAQSTKFLQWILASWLFSRLLYLGCYGGYHMLWLVSRVNVFGNILQGKSWCGWKEGKSGISP